MAGVASEEFCEEIVDFRFGLIFFLLNDFPRSE